MRTTSALCLAVFLLLCAFPAQAQVAWVKYSGNPVLDLGDPGEWDDTRLGPGHIILEGGTYKFWYGGWDGTTNKNYQIGLATSTDGTGWIRCGSNPVLRKGDPGDWDSLGVGLGSVIKDGGIYKMWYSGSNGAARCIGYATSPDGITWNKHNGNPVLSPDAGEWDSWAVHWCTVVKDGSEYKMWYSGSQDLLTSHRIGFATSPNGTTWTKYAGNPILGPEHVGSWDDTQVYFPYVLKEGATYHMWYAGYDGSYSRIGYASSLDGIVWQVNGYNPVVGLGDSGEWDDESVNVPCVLLVGSDWKMWYQGFSSGDTARIGYAEEPALAVPAATEWALAVLVLLLLSIGVILIVRRRVPA